MLVVRAEEPMRVAPEGHVIDLKAGEEATGSLAEYLVASRCNVTVVEGDSAPVPGGGGGLSASLTATAGIVQDVPAGPEPGAPVKTAKTRKAAA